MPVSTVKEDNRISAPNSNPPDYDLNNPETKWELPAELKEISGNDWIDNNHLLAIEDQTPNLYILKLESGKAFIEHKILFKESTEKKI